MPTPTQPLTALDVTHLHTVLAAADRGASMRWASEYDDEVRTGVARRVGAYDGYRHHDVPDVRDQFLHVSGAVELWLPMADVLTMLAEHTLAFEK